MRLAAVFVLGVLLGLLLQPPSLIAQKGTATPSPGKTRTPAPTVTPSPGPTPTSTTTPAPGSAVVFVASQGWTPQAVALIPAIAAQPGVKLRVHGGDVDFSYADLAQACINWPGLAYYCDGSTLVVTPDQVRAGWRGMMSPIFPGPWVIAWGNHEDDGMKGGTLQPYYTGLFGQTARWFSLPWQTGMGDARVFVLDTTQSLAPGSPQRTWFEAELARYRTATWKVIFAHGQPWSQLKPSLALQEIGGLLDAEGVDVWMGGHPLIWERTRQVTFNTADPRNPTVVDGDDDLRKGAGRVYVSAGGGGMHVCGTFGIGVPAPLKPWMAKVVCYDNTFAVLRWSVDGLVLTVQAIDQRGAVRDSVRIAY